MNKDSKLIFEAYHKKLEEGLFDRLKARTAGLGGTVKGLGDRVAGGVKGAFAGLQGDVEAGKAAAKQGLQGKISGDVAKINSYKNTANKKIQNLTYEILDDLNKLGIDIDMNSKMANGFMGNLNKGFETLVKELEAKAAPAPATKPAVAAPAPEVSAPDAKMKIVSRAKDAAKSKEKAKSALPEPSKTRFRKVYK